MIIILFLKYLIKCWVRQLYWLYRLSKANLGKNLELGFPIINEGKGLLKIGNDVKISKNVNLKVEKNSTLIISNGVKILDNCEINVSNNSTLIIYDNAILEQMVKIYVKKDSFIGKNTFIASNVSIFSREELIASFKIGEYCGIGNGSIIDVSETVVIGDNVALGSNCTIYTHDHSYENLDLPAWKGEVIKKPVTINRNSWIGSGTTILQGITIGEGSVVGSGSLVNINIPELEVWVGRPARKIKSRN